MAEILVKDLEGNTLIAIDMLDLLSRNWDGYEELEGYDADNTDTVIRVGDISLDPEG